MSQINDALKRAKDAQREQPPNLPPTPPLSPGEGPPRNGGLGWVFLILLILVVACVFIALAFSHRPPQVQNPLLVAPTQTVQTVASVAPVIPKTNVVVVPPKPLPPPLKLQGILFNNPPQAIVNGQTVFVGDMVNGFRVQTIAKDNVVFLAPDGTQKKLMVND